LAWDAKSGSLKFPDKLKFFKAKGLEEELEVIRVVMIQNAFGEDQFLY